MCRSIRDCGRHFKPLNILYYSIVTPTVWSYVTSVVVDTYECDDGRIGPTRCALIDRRLGGRGSQGQGCRTPPPGARSARSVLAAASRLASPADPGGFPRSKTTPRSRTRPCDDASPARCAPGTHPSPLPPCRVGSWLQYTIIKTAINLSPAESLPIIGRDALLALVNWFERQRPHDPSSPIQDRATRACGAAAAADCPAEPDGDAVPADDTASGGNPR